MSIEDNMVIARYKGMKKIRRSLNRKTRQEFKELLVQLEMNLGKTG